jgi:murein DD-endopeptidase MepM/ murein hydrolase activator NlpD
MRVALNILSILSLSVLLIACGSVRSGKYIKLTSKGHLERLIKHHKISKVDLQQHNPGKKLVPGAWIFVPIRTGLVAISGLQPPQPKASSPAYSTHGFLWPVPSSRHVSSFYGKRSGRHHDGIDISAPKGTLFVASQSGKVIYAGWMKGYGKVMIIKHPKSVYTVYAHASKIFFKKGEQVQKGQRIGKIGATGRATGPHLHFEIRVNRKHQNPFKYIANHRSNLAAQ